MNKESRPLFISDTHFGHANIIKYSKRPFTDVDHMNESMIANWNSKVRSTDTVFHLGDIGFGNNLPKILNRLNGEIILIEGNHDPKLIRDPRIRNRFSRICDVYTLKYQGQEIFMSHYAHRVWNKSHRGGWHLYGHSHGSLPDDPNSRSFDVGVDCHNYFPLTFEEVKKIMDAKNWSPIDHHGARDHEKEGST